VLELHPVAQVEEKSPSTIESDALRLWVKENLYRVHYCVLEGVLSDV